MIKFIATDVDGTLVKDSAPDIYPEIYDEIKRLTDKGIIFCVASGRQYYSILRLFEPVSDKIVFIAQNGALVRTKDEILSSTVMNQEYAREIVQDIRSLGLDLVVTTEDGDLVESEDELFLDLLINSYHNKLTRTKDVLDTDKKIVKVAAYKRGSIRELGDRILMPKWREKVKCCLAGEEWVDFMDRSVDKGYAMRFLQEKYGFNKDESLAFGDNENDMGMLMAAGESYAVSSARDVVKDCATHICDSYDKRGVLRILQSM